MNNNELEEFAEMWTAVREDIYGKTVSATAMNIVFKSLQRFSVNDIQRAIEIHVNDTENGRFPIMPAHIVANIEGAGQERSSEAFSKLVSGVSGIGPHEDVVFDDPAIHAIVHNEGGWIKVCEMNEDDMKFFQTRFIKQYVSYVSRREFSFPKLLRGITNAYNSNKKNEDGTPAELNKPSVIGDKDAARLVYEKGAGSNLKITHSHEIESEAKKLLVNHS